MRRGSSCVYAAASSRQAKTYCDYSRASKTLSDRCCWRRKLGGLSLGVHYSCRNKRGATTTTTKKKKAIQKNLEQHSCLLSDREENPLLCSSSSPPPPLSCFLFSGIAQSAILRQANEDFQKQLQQQLQEKDSSIFRFLPKI